jgi:hypothetical protein
VRLHDALAPGLAAELAAWFMRAPLTAGFHADQQALTWSFEALLPDRHDVQLPACLRRLARFLDQDVPELAQAITGRRLAPPMQGVLHLWAWRRGAYVDAGRTLAPLGGIDVMLGLTGARWPAEVGGQLELGAAAQRLEPGFDTLDLFEPCSFTVSLVTRPVVALAVRSYLVPVD